MTRSGMASADWGWLVLLSLLWGSGTFFNAVAVPDIAPLTVALARVLLAAGTLLLVPVALVVDQPWQGVDWTWRAVLAVVALGVLGTAVRALVYCRLLTSAGATSTSLVGFLIPVSSLALGVLLLGERLAVAHVGGLALIVLGMLVVDGKLAALKIMLPHRVGIH